MWNESDLSLSECRGADFLPLLSCLPSLLTLLHLSVDLPIYLLDFPPSLLHLPGRVSIYPLDPPPPLSLPTSVEVIRGRYPSPSTPLSYLRASFTLFNSIIFLFCSCLHHIFFFGVLIHSLLHYFLILPMSAPYLSLVSTLS